MAEDDEALPAIIGGLLVGFIVLLIIKFLGVFSMSETLIQSIVELVVGMTVIVGFGILGLLVNDTISKRK